MHKDGCRKHVNSRKLLCKDCRALPKDYVNPCNRTYEREVSRYSDPSYYDQYQPYTPFIPAFSVDQGLADTYVNYEPRHAESDSKPVESSDPRPVASTPEPSSYYPSEDSSSSSSYTDSGSSGSYDSGSY